METRRWTNPTQPQTLQYAVMLLYINAVFGLVFGNILFFWGTLVGLAALVSFAAGGFGIANERRWGYNLALGAAGAEALTLMYIVVSPDYSGGANLFISLMFAVALVGLLLHPQSREYQKIWFS